jgi:NitT/TauT family transport system substrate-binding protein
MKLNRAGAASRVGGGRALAAAALLLALTGCGKGAGETSNAAAETAAPAAAAAGPALKIGYSDWPGWIPWEIAKQKGLFEKNGVSVELVWMDYVPSMEAFAAGKLDAVTMTNGDALVTGATAQKPATAILINDYSNGNDMIIARPGIASMKDLKGKKVGVEVGFVDHLLLLNGLEKNGLTEKDVTLVNVPTNETPQALSAGGVDAIGAWQPSSGQALKIVPGSKSIYTSADAPGIIYDLLYTSRESLASRRADWVKVVKTWYDVVDYMNDPANRQEMLTILSARVKLTPAEYAPLMAGTHILPLAEALPIFNGEVGDGFKSLAGSSSVVDAFNLKYKVYAKSEASADYIDPSLTEEVATARGMKVDKTTMR